MPIIEVIKKYPREVLIAMGMRMAENISLLPVHRHLDHLRRRLTSALGQGRDLKALLIGAAIQFVRVPVDRRAVRPGRPPAALPAGAVGVGVVDVRLLRPDRHRQVRAKILLARRRRPASSTR